MKQKSYTKDFKESILKKLQPPENKSVPEISKETGISKNILYTWVSNNFQKRVLLMGEIPD